MVTPYRIEVRPAALRALRKIDRQDQPRIHAAIALLARTPRPPAAKALQVCAGLRVRIGDHKIVYTVDDGVLVIVVVTLGHQ